MFSQRFKQLKEELGLSQKGFADVFNQKYGFNISYSTVSYWETDKGRYPDFDVLTKLAEFFECTTDYLLGVSDSKNREDKESRIQYSNEVSIRVDKVLNSLLAKGIDGSSFFNNALSLLENSGEHLSKEDSESYLCIANVFLYTILKEECNFIDFKNKYEEMNSRFTQGLLNAETIDEEIEIQLSQLRDFNIKNAEFLSRTIPNAMQLLRLMPSKSRYSVSQEYNIVKKAFYSNLSEIH